MSAIGAVHLSLVLLIAVSVYAGFELGRDDLKLDARMALVANLAGVAAVWIRADKPVEGRILLVLTPFHGLTEADLLSLIPLALAAVILWRSRAELRPLLAQAADWSMRKR